MRFSWIGLIVAPSLVPALFSAALVMVSSDANPLFGFVFMFVLACIVSYGTMIVLFLPSLFLLSLRWPMTGFRVCLLGLVLGALAFVPLTLMVWKSSGPDSGPPTESFFVFFARWVADPMAAMYPVAGLVTAGAYWWLVSWRRKRTAPAQG